MDNSLLHNRCVLTANKLVLNVHSNCRQINQVAFFCRRNSVGWSELLLVASLCTFLRNIDILYRSSVYWMLLHVVSSQVFLEVFCIKHTALKKMTNCAVLASVWSASFSVLTTSVKGRPTKTFGDVEVVMLCFYPFYRTNAFPDGQLTMSKIWIAVVVFGFCLTNLFFWR